jgi:hypothetical protein
MSERLNIRGTRRAVFAAGLAAMVLCTLSASAQGPKGRSFGFGFELGEPTAVTFRFWESRLNSWDAAIGTSHLGNPQIHADYLWHFTDVFNSRVVSLYAGVGGLVGLGEKGRWVWGKWKGDKHDYWWYDEDENRLLFAARGVFGLNIIPKNTAIDIFLEVDPVLGIVPGFGFDFQTAVGIRFYP